MDKNAYTNHKIEFKTSEYNLQELKNVGCQKNIQLSSSIDLFTSYAHKQQTDLKSTFNLMATSGLYEIFFDGFKDDLPLYSFYAKQLGEPILELMCGTGRIILHLARLGFRMTGIDISQGMLDICMLKIRNDKKLKDIVTLHCGNVNDFILSQPLFKLAIVAYGSFGYLRTKTEKLRTLTNIRKSLRKDGLLIIDDINGHSWANAIAMSKGGYIDSINTKSDFLEFLTINRTTKYQLNEKENQLTRTQQVIIQSSNKNIVKQFSFTEVIQYTPAHETKFLLKNVGFRNIEVYGSYEDAMLGKGKGLGYNFVYPELNQRQIFLATA